MYTHKYYSPHILTHTLTYTHNPPEPVLRHTSPEVSDLDRHDSIVRSSWLSGADRTAAQVARRRAISRVSMRQSSDETPIEGTFIVWYKIYVWIDRRSY